MVKIKKTRRKSSLEILIHIGPMNNNIFIIQKKSVHIWRRAYIYVYIHICRETNLANDVYTYK